MTSVTRRILDWVRRVCFNGTMSTTAKTCRCGCGGTTTNRYQPGHDAKHKGRLADESRSGSEAAIREMVEHGWGSWVPDGLIDQVPQRNDEGKRTSHRDLVDMWFVDLAGVKHTSRKCAAIDRGIDRFTIGRPYGWDLCKWCTHTETYREEWERAEMRKVLAKEAMRQVARPMPKLTKPVSWVVPPDGTGSPIYRTLHPGGQITYPTSVEEYPTHLMDQPTPPPPVEGKVSKRGLHRPASVWQTSH